LNHNCDWIESFNSCKFFEKIRAQQPAKDAPALSNYREKSNKDSNVDGQSQDIKFLNQLKKIYDTKIVQPKSKPIFIQELHNESNSDFYATKKSNEFLDLQFNNDLGNNESEMPEILNEEMNEFGDDDLIEVKSPVIDLHCSAPQSENDLSISREEIHIPTSPMHNKSDSGIFSENEEFDLEFFDTPKLSFKRSLF